MEMNILKRSSRARSPNEGVISPILAARDKGMEAAKHENA